MEPYAVKRVHVPGHDEVDIKFEPSDKAAALSDFVRMMEIVNQRPVIDYIACDQKPVGLVVVRHAAE